MKKLAIITTHPIQYNAPWFRLLAQKGNITIMVFYTWGQSQEGQKYDPGFGTNITWDIPLLTGYDHCFVENISTSPGSHHFKGIDNPTLIAQIEQWNPTALLVFGWSFKSHLKLLRHFKGKRKILFRGDSTLLDESDGFSFKKKIRRLFLQWVYSHIDIALYVGTANKEYFLAHGLKNTQLVFAPHAIDNDRFMEDVAWNKRSELRIPPNLLVFIFAGKFEAKKDPQILLDSFIQLGDTDAHLLMVGSGEMETSLKTKARQQPPGICERIHFLPFQNQLNMPGIYRTGDIFVLPSRGPRETWGLSVNEAMACSRTVLVSDKCGCAVDLVEPGINGFVFKNKDGNDLLKKMEMLLLNHQATADMGKRSLQIIQSWSFEKICIAIEQSMA
ncbi:MAG: glycosyltransferase family 4 protein [Ferruginibacter sp.]